jgi:hypothetical protein
MLQSLGKAIDSGSVSSEWPNLVHILLLALIIYCVTEISMVMGTRDERIFLLDATYWIIEYNKIN